jgi:hypothetical protein
MFIPIQDKVFFILNPGKVRSWIRIRNTTWRVCRPVVADLHHSDEKQDLDPDLNTHRSENLDPDLH